VLRKAPPPGADTLVNAIDRHTREAVSVFKFTDPSSSAPSLARALAATRTALAQLGADPDVKFLLDLKAQQIAEAMHACLGIHLSAVAQPAGTPESSGPFSPGPPGMAAVIPGQTFEVRTAFVIRAGMPIVPRRIALESNGRSWKIADAGAAQAVAAAAAGSPKTAGAAEPTIKKFSVIVPDDAPLSRPNFSRGSIQDSRYTTADERLKYEPSGGSALDAIVTYEVDGVPVEMRRPVVRLEPNLPYGYDSRVLAVVPAIAVTLTPSNAVAPLGAAAKKIAVDVELLNNREGQSAGTLVLKVPDGWKTTPASQSFAFARAGERALYRFVVAIPSLTAREYRIEAVASSAGREYREGYTTIRHRDLETRYLYRPATASVKGVDVKIPSGLKVGYVMGVGDEVPSGLAQVGVAVQLLNERDLATRDLSAFDTIMTGTRAYAVREDLKTYNRRLLDYVKNGGNLIVLYNTQEFVPELYAPYPGTLPASAEEVSEEDSPVRILAPEDRVLNIPNRITAADFNNWVEQRGSKFWTTWDSRYTPLIATWDKGQEPQKGGWLHATYGKGHYTYFAYAFHRQLPYGVPGAYRLLANLLSLNQGVPRPTAKRSAGQLTSSPANSAR
jgi:hypothetical protein